MFGRFKVKILILFTKTHTLDIFLHFFVVFDNYPIVVADFTVKVVVVLSVVSCMHASKI